MLRLPVNTFNFIGSGFLLLFMASCGGSAKFAKPSAERQNPAFEHELIKGKKDFPVTEEDPEANQIRAATALMRFIQEWEGTPHRMGGNTKQGVDCSGFVIQAYSQVYQRSFLGRRAEDIFGETTPVKKEELREGDLVFFKINGRRIDHVGIYLNNENFVHVSSSRGVMISSLQEEYFIKRFFMGGRYP